MFRSLSSHADKLTARGGGTDEPGQSCAAGSDRTWHWRPWLAPRQLPPGLLPWLHNGSSLTRQLTLLHGGPIRVERLSQCWLRPARNEAQLLGLPPGQRALIREVILWAGDEPWVYARSVLPISALQGDLVRLRHLRNAPLGALLFRHRNLTRTPFEFAALPRAALPSALPVAPAITLYGRRSRFALGGRRLIVAEVFLPAFRPIRRPRPA